MRYRRLFILISLLAALGLLAACQPAGTEPQIPATEEGEATPVIEPTDEREVEEGGGLPPAAVLAVEAALSEALGISVEQIETVSFEQREWPNACLGLPAQDEMCAEVITPGFLVTLAAGGETYQVRTNLEATNVRIEGEEISAGEGTETPDPEAEQPPAVVAARQALAERLDIELEAVDVLSFEAREWPDACLGLAAADEMCAQVITPGYLVTLRAEGEIHEARTNQDGSAVRFAGSGVSLGTRPVSRETVVVLQRSGGIQGEVVEWRLYRDARVEKASGPPGPDQTVESRMLDNPRHLQQLLADLEAAGFFELSGNYMPTDPCCDRYHYLLAATLDDQSNTIETVAGTEDVPPAVWESIELVESLMTGLFPEPITK